MTNNSKEQEEKTVQNPPIENHDNSRNTEAMEGQLEQSQSIFGEQTIGHTLICFMAISKTFGTFELFGPWLRLAVMQNGCSIFPDYKRAG
jgi:hypothetical protein